MLCLFNTCTFHIDYVLDSGASFVEEPHDLPKHEEDEDDEPRPLVITCEAVRSDSTWYAQSLMIIWVTFIIETITCSVACIHSISLYAFHNTSVWDSCDLRIKCWVIVYLSNDLVYVLYIVPKGISQVFELLVWYNVYYCVYSYVTIQRHAHNTCA